MEAGSVIPGRTRSTDRHTGLERSTNSGTSGLGPTTDISARTIFQSWGSSSNLNFRKKWPTRVTRGSLLTVRGEPVMPCRMVRNLSIRKSSPLRPTRFCENMIGKPDSRNMLAAITRRNGDNRSSAMAEKQLSIHCRHPEDFGTSRSFSG